MKIVSENRLSGKTYFYIIASRELYGTTYAKPIVVKYGKDDGSSSDHEESQNSIKL